MTVVTHPLAGANSLCSVTDADAFNSGRPAIFGSKWASLTTEKDGLLIASTRLFVTSCVWKGKLVEDLDHDLPFPRTELKHPVTGATLSSTTVPTDVALAVALLADYMGSGLNPFSKGDGAGLKKFSVKGVMDYEPDNSSAPPSIPFEVLQIIRPYTISISLATDNASSYTV